MANCQVKSMNTFEVFSTSVSNTYLIHVEHMYLTKCMGHIGAILSQMDQKIANCVALGRYTGNTLKVVLF